MNREQIEKGLTEISSFRKEERQRLIERTARQLYSYLKQFNYRFMTDKLLKGFFSIDTPQQTRNSVSKAIFSVLKATKRIKESSIRKFTQFYRVMPLYTNDYESYAVLMSKNGYKHNYYIYNYDDEKHIPIKKKIGSSKGYNAKLTEDSDVITNISSKARSRQGCFSGDNISIRKVKQFYKVKVYTIV